MLDFKSIFAQELSKNISSISLDELYFGIEEPKNADLGDYAFACFKLAKEYRKSPQIIAQEIAPNIKNEYIEAVNVVGAYINIKIKKVEKVKNLLNELADKKEKYGSSDEGKGKKVIVEFSSANIAKPFHIGHLRSTVIGNSLYRIYSELGYESIAINHLGDYGTQFGKLIVAFEKWGSKSEIEKSPIREMLKLYIKFHEEVEKNPELDDEARVVFTKLEHGDERIIELWKWIVEMSLVEFKRVYSMLGVNFDSWNGEAFYSDKIDSTLKMLRDSNILEKSDGAEIVDLSEYSMPPALITKKDGSSLYMTRDIAAAIYRKNEYDFYKNIYVVAYQQDLHFKQWFKVLELAGMDWANDCVHVNFGMVSLAGGTLSTRKGNVVFLEEVLNKSIEMISKIIDEKNPNLENKDKVSKQVGVGAIVFQDLFNLRIKDYVFDWDKALSFDGETGPYVQYTHARTCSLIEKSGIKASYDIDYELIVDDASLELVKVLSEFSSIIKEAAEHNEPSKITRYTISVAQTFNKFYQTNHINVEDTKLKKARISLVLATQLVLKKSLYLIGLEAPSRM